MVSTCPQGTGKSGRSGWSWQNPFIYLGDVGDSLILQHFWFSFFLLSPLRFCREKKTNLKKPERCFKERFEICSSGPFPSHWVMLELPTGAGSSQKTSPGSSKKPGIAGNAGAGSLLGFLDQDREEGKVEQKVPPKGLILSSGTTFPLEMVLGTAAKVRKGRIKSMSSSRTDPGFAHPSQQSWALFSCSDFPSQTSASPGGSCPDLLSAAPQTPARGSVSSGSRFSIPKHPKWTLLGCTEPLQLCVAHSSGMGVAPVVCLLGVKVSPQVSPRFFSRILQLSPSFPASWCVLILCFILPLRGTAGWCQIFSQTQTGPFSSLFHMEISSSWWEGKEKARGGKTSSSFFFLEPEAQKQHG